MKRLDSSREQIGSRIGSPVNTPAAQPAGQQPPGQLGIRAVRADPAAVGSHRLPPVGAALPPQVRTPRQIAPGSGAWPVRPRASTPGLVGTTLNRSAQRLGVSTIHASHPVLGNLTITRAAELKPANQFNFSLRLDGRGKTGPKNAIAQACIDPADRCNAYQPSVGYSDINLTPLDRAGIGSLLHAHMAKTGMELGVDTFVIESITTAPMFGFCDKMGMNYVRYDACRVPMQQLYDRAKRSAEAKGWTFDPDLAG